jgi:purine-binding chemotaxis protein CheW
MRPLVVFSIADQRYALDLPVVERVLQMVELSVLPKAPNIVLGVINLHGEIIPVVDIRRRFGHPSSHYSPTSLLLIARTSRRKLALPVDEAHGVQHLSSENVAPPETVFPGTSLVAGIAALPDGVLFIHDLDMFLSSDEERRLTETLESLPA